MSPISPFVTGGGQGNWQMPDLTLHEHCPVCGSELTSVMGAIGGFPGHEQIHPTSVTGYRCNKCVRYFTLGEFLLLRKEKAREKARPDFAKNYWKNIRTIFSNPCLLLVVLGFALLSHNFLTGIAAGIIVAFLLPLFGNGCSCKIIFALFSKLDKLTEQKFRPVPPDKPPDNPKTP